MTTLTMPTTPGATSGADGMRWVGNKAWRSTGLPSATRWLDSGLASVRLSKALAGELAPIKTTGRRVQFNTAAMIPGLAYEATTRDGKFQFVLNHDGAVTVYELLS